MSEECVVVYIEGDKVTKKEIVKGDIVTVVKSYAKRLIDEWNAEISDFIILHDNYTLTLKRPLKKEIVDKVRRFNPRIVGDKVEITLPLYEITYSNRWIEGSFQADNFVVVLPYISDEITNQVIYFVIKNLVKREEEEALPEEEA